MPTLAEDTPLAPERPAPAVHQYPMRVSRSLFDAVRGYANQRHDGSIYAAIRFLVSDGLARAGCLPVVEVQPEGYVVAGGQ